MQSVPVILINCFTIIPWRSLILKTMKKILGDSSVKFLFIKSDRHIGVSNFYVPHLKRLLKICDSKCLQKPYTYGRDLDIIRFCNKTHIGIVPTVLQGRHGRSQASANRLHLCAQSWWIMSSKHCGRSTPRYSDRLWKQPRSPTPGTKGIHPTTPCCPQWSRKVGA